MCNCVQVPRFASSGNLQGFQKIVNQINTQVSNISTRIEVTLQPMGVQVPRFASSGYLQVLQRSANHIRNLLKIIFRTFNTHAASLIHLDTSPRLANMSLILGSYMPTSRLLWSKGLLTCSPRVCRCLDSRVLVLCRCIGKIKQHQKTIV